MSSSDKKREDFYEHIIGLIQQNKRDEAIKSIQALPDQDAKFSVLKYLIITMMLAVDRFRKGSSLDSPLPGLAVNAVHELAGDMVYDLARALANTHKIKGMIDHLRELDSDTAEKSQLPYTTDYCITLINVLEGMVSTTTSEQPVS